MVRKEIANKLSKIKQQINLDYEVMMVYRKDETTEDVFKRGY